MGETTQQRPLTAEEEFEAYRIAFGQILLSNARAWEGYRSYLQKEGMKKIIEDVRAACTIMEGMILTLDNQTVRPISEEAYEAKKEAGKKVTWAVDQGKSPLKQEDDR